MVITYLTGNGFEEQNMFIWKFEKCFRKTRLKKNPPREFPTERGHNRIEPVSRPPNESRGNTFARFRYDADLRDVNNKSGGQRSASQTFPKLVRSQPHSEANDSDRNPVETSAVWKFSMRSYGLFDAPIAIAREVARGKRRAQSN